MVKRGAQLVHADGIPLLIPINSGRDVEALLIIRLLNPRAVARQMSIF
ncbi:hypothetical protein SBP18_20120 [Rhodoferax ferrireducens]|nr:hypothetical protein [Rhodoferax ferrireducens]WPC66747.1 hypothetical protein SBP18_20120 [Rhodoferax ferrireducens]